MHAAFSTPTYRSWRNIETIFAIFRLISTLAPDCHNTPLIDCPYSQETLLISKNQVMQQIKHSIRYFIPLSFILAIACNGPATSEEKGTDTTPTITGRDTPAAPPYDPAMDGLRTGAAFCKALGDSLNIKMYECTLKPGDSAVLHTHPDHTIYVIQGGTLAVTLQGAGRHVMELKAGEGSIGGPLSDAAKNVGNTTIKILIHDIYRPRGK